MVSWGIFNFKCFIYNLNFKNSKQKGNTFYKEFNNFMVLPYLPNVLVTFAVGSGSQFIETLRQEVLIDVVSEVFNRTMPSLKLPRPTQVIA